MIDPIQVFKDAFNSTKTHPDIKSHLDLVNNNYASHPTTTGYRVMIWPKNEDPSWKNLRIADGKTEELAIIKLLKKLDG